MEDSREGGICVKTSSVGEKLASLFSRRCCGTCCYWQKVESVVGSYGYCSRGGLKRIILATGPFMEYSTPACEHYETRS